MAEHTFATDFSPLFNLLASNREFPATRLLAHTRYPDVLEHVSDNQAVQSTLKTLNDDIGTVKAAIEDTQKLFKFFKAQLQELYVKVSEYKSLLAPIRRLPVEVLQEIFLDAEAPFRVHHSLPPVVAQVNQYWRHVAFTTPRLWTTSVLTLGTERTVVQTDALKRAMALSRLLPVSLVIRTSTAQMPYRYDNAYESSEDDYSDSDGWEEEDYRGGITSKGVHNYRAAARRRERDEHNNRMQEIEHNVTASAKALAQNPFMPFLGRLSTIIILRYSDALQDFLDSLDGVKVASCLTQLESLVVPAVIWADMNKRSLPFKLAPHLKRLHINLTPSERKVLSPGSWKDIPWDTLTAFRGPLSSSELVACFSSSAEALRVAEITIPAFMPGPPRPNPAHSPLRNLTSLCIQATSFPESPDLLPPLPALRHLLSQLELPQGELPGTRSDLARIDFKPHVLVMVGAWGSGLEYFGIDVASLPNALDQSSLGEILDATPNINALGIPSPWLSELDKLVPRVNRIAHLEAFSSNHVAPGRVPQTQDISPEALRGLQTLTFLERHKGSEIQSMAAAEEKAKTHGLKITISRHPLRDMPRFSSPYFLQKGGVFAQCLADEIARERIGVDNW